MNDKRAVLEVGAGDATDSAIDTQFIAEMSPDRYALKDSDGILDPDAIARRLLAFESRASKRLDP